MNQAAMLATLLQRQYGSKAPILLEPLLEANNITVVNWSFVPPMVGMAKRGTHKNFIAVHEGLNDATRRWVTGHEAAHLILHDGNQYYLTKDSYFNIIADKQEYQAQVFAAYYLIPEKELIKMSHLPLEDIADHFLVPMHLLEFRIKLYMSERNYR